MTAKIDLETAEEIRARYRRGRLPTMRQLGRRYGVSASTINAVVHGHRWNPPAYLTEAEYQALKND